MNQMKLFCMLLTTTLLLVNCQDDDGLQVEIREERMAEIASHVEALIANRSCNGVDDCASIAWGSKPCGGPWEYLVYAPSNVDVPQLEQLVAEYNQLQDEVNRLKELGSDCALVQEPSVECVEGLCLAGFD